MCKHNFSHFGNPVESCVICGQPHPYLVEWRKLVAQALEEGKQAPQHPYLTWGFWTLREYKKYMRPRR